MIDEVRIRKVGEGEYVLDVYDHDERVATAPGAVNLVVAVSCLARWFDDDPYGFIGPSAGTVADEIIAAVKQEYDVEDGESPSYYGALQWWGRDNL